MFGRKKQEISINIDISLNKHDYLINEQISGSLTLCNSDSISIEAITLHLDGSFSTFNFSKNELQEDRKIFYQTQPIVILAANNAKILTIPAGNHPIKFTLPPLNTQVSTNCCLTDKIKVSWNIVSTIIFEKSKTPVMSGSNICFHMGHDIAVLEAPSSVVIAKQIFMTHLPIQYQCVLHKTAFIEGETVALTLSIKNNSRMKLLSMLCELKQKWTVKKRIEEFTALRFEINSAPIFPVESKGEIEQMIQFKLPSNLIPSIFINKIKKEFTPVLIDYYFDLEFVTEKGDKYSVHIPITIEDNYPPREIIPPPKPQEIQTNTNNSNSNTSQLPIYDNNNNKSNNPSFSNISPSNRNILDNNNNNNHFPLNEPPPSYNFNTPSINPSYESSNKEIKEENSDSLYPILPGMQPYIPNNNIPSFNPSYTN